MNCARAGPPAPHAPVSTMPAMPTTALRLRITRPPFPGDAGILPGGGPRPEGFSVPAERQAHAGRAPRPPAARGFGAAVLERQGASVRLGDLARQREADAGALGLGGEERHEQVRG